MRTIGPALLMTLMSCLLLSLNGLGQNPIPADEQEASVLITGVTVHIGNGKEIQEGAVGFRNGVIDFVGSAARSPKGYDVIKEAKGQHLYPGFITVDSKLGLKEIGAVRASQDARETGGINPHVRSIIAYNTDSRITPTVRSNGVLMAQIAPEGGLISGSSSVVHFDAWNWEDALIEEDGSIYVNWPNERSWNWESRSLKANERYEEEVAELKAFLSRAKAYAEGPNSKVQLREEACRGLFDGSKKLFVRANRAKSMIGAIHLSQDLGIDELVIVGGYDADKVIDLLKDEEVPVIIASVHGLPNQPEHSIDHAYTLAKTLSDAGIQFCIGNSQRMSEMNTMNLPFQAGTCVAHGLDKRLAIKALTLDAASILGVDDRCGSIEVGKQATLFISEGDALDMRTNNIQLAYVQGRAIDLDNHQKFLNRKFRKKYGLKVQ